MTLAQLGQTGHADLFMPDGQVLSPDAAGLAPIDPDAWAKLRAAALTDYVEITLENTPCLASQSPIVASTGDPAIARLGWTLILHQDRSEALAGTEVQTRGMTLIVLTMAALAAGAAVGVSRWVAGPIARLIAVARRVAEGDLTAQARVESGDETGVLAATFNTMTAKLGQTLNSEREQREYLQSTIARYLEYLAQVRQGNLAARVAPDGQGRDKDDHLVALGHNLNETTASLQNMVAQIRKVANNLSSAVGEILAATTQQASGASEQSAAISQTTTTVDEVKTIAEQASLRAQEMADASQRTVQVSRTGQKAVQDTIESMNQIKERVEGIAENILALSEQTQQIGEIISTVNEIASQSNILALNASIEAARAGEHGKGFAVVAVEVRNLAEQSRQATAQVKSILSEIQRATNATVIATEEGTKGVDKGMTLAAQTRQAIEQLSGVINESAQAATQMVAGGRQQVTGIDQIALAMRNINQATMQSLGSTRQAEKSAQSLNELARSLSRTVEQYKL
jgi:methyl-accepting chemotaxis protein